MIPAGELDRRLALFSPIAGKTPLGADQTTFAPAGKVWAKKVDVRDGERIQAQQVGEAITSRFTVRWNSRTSVITAGWQAEHRGVRYAVTGAKDVGTREDREITAVALVEAAQR